MEINMTMEQFSTQITAQDDRLMEALRQVGDRSEPQDIRTMKKGGGGGGGGGSDEGGQWGGWS